jgi:hypothetical protein
VTDQGVRTDAQDRYERALELIRDDGRYTVTADEF